MFLPTVKKGNDIILVKMDNMNRLQTGKTQAPGSLVKYILYWTEQAAVKKQLKVVINLKSKPLSEEAKSIKEQALPEVDSLAGQIKDIFSKS